MQLPAALSQDMPTLPHESPKYLPDSFQVEYLLAE
jgi:hypothetical protein